MSTVNVRDFGALGDGKADDTSSLATAFKQKSLANGGTCHLPAGNYRITSRVTIPSGVTFCGDGNATQILGTQQMLVADDTDAATIRDMAIGCDVSADYATAIAANRARNFTVERCHIFATGPIQNWTLHAVLAQGATGLRVERNLIERMQVKAAGALGGRDLFVIGNRIIAAHASAISCVIAEDADEIGNVVISDNIIDSAYRAGIYVGNDRTDVHQGTIRGVTIARNHVVGAWGPKGLGIMARFCRTTSDIAVIGNVVRNDDPNPNPGSFGILVNEAKPGVVAQRVVVADNLVDHMDWHGVRVVGAVDGLALHGNVVTRTRGIELMGVEEGGGIRGSWSANSPAVTTTGMVLSQ